MEANKCPFHRSTSKPNHGTQNHHWWPNNLNLGILRQHDTKSNPLKELNYREAVKKLDFDSVKRDLKILMTNSME